MTEEKSFIINYIILGRNEGEKEGKFPMFELEFIEQIFGDP
jgi:hypothetical protein